MKSLESRFEIFKDSNLKNKNQIEYNFYDVTVPLFALRHLSDLKDIKENSQKYFEGFGVFAVTSAPIALYSILYAIQNL